MSEVLFKRGKLANLPVETDPNTFYLIEDAKTIQIGGAVLQDTNDVKVELKGIINDKYAATTQKITELEEQMVNTSALTKVEEMIPVSTSQLTNDSGFLTIKDLPSDLTAYVTEEELVEKGYTTTSYVDKQMSSKQDVISDLEGIRDGASKGSTAIQPNDIANVATSGSYDDLLNKPTIPDAVTESDVSNWGFTKNTGTYSKPTDGIPQTDLSNEVQALLNKADTALQSIPSEYVTETVLNDKGYLTEVPSEYITESELNNKNYVIKTELDNFVLVDDFTSLAEIVDDIVDDKIDANVLSGYSTTSHTHDDKQDVITDLDSIRTNAALGATALQSIPNEYITESELNAKGYITEHQDISGKQDVISDIDTIRANASLGATALQSIPSEYITESELNAKGYLTSIPSEYITETELSNKGYATKAELTRYTTDAEYNTLVTTVNSKANSSALTNYSTTSHTHGDLYYTETEIDSKLNTKQNVISDLDTIRSGASKGATALQSIPSEYAKITDVEEMINNAITLTLNTEI